ncbi:KGG domain-containing protein [Nitrosomonas communis]|uniref:Stress-induced acidophilic repeat motif-containing protein n=1 Tax=Nitrosomonas communis TaxID=44574 RepID=A0A1H2UU92_9PROT|nr:KGG domain-containing protein [Nitrosomonas communis]SDW59645.1 Stress-induced acidophilic repeat motif-containing protein [Nitrosomonas communis]
MSSNKGKDEDNKGTSQRGFASINEEKQREIASKGGHAAYEKGAAHEFTSEEVREAGRKGGHATHEKVTAHEFSSEEAREAGRKGGYSRGKGDSEDKGKSSLPLLVAAHLSSMRKQAGKAIKIANQQ